MSLPKLTVELVNACKTCNRKRSMVCPQCRGTGRIRTTFGAIKIIRCHACRGTKKIKCPNCEKRLKSRRNQGYIRTLESLLP